MTSIFTYKQNTKEMFNRILSNDEACKMLTDTFYEQIENRGILEEISPAMFTKALFSAYEN